MRKGWEIKKLGEVCLVIAGQSPEGKFYNNEALGLPFYQGKKEFTDKFIGKPTTWTSVITKEAKKDDILMSVRAPVGPINFATQRICIGRGLAAIRASELVDKNFIYSFLIKHESEIVGNSGAVFNSINKNQIENIQIPIPLLPEQQRIVSILDEAFSSIEQAKENLQRNLQNAKELFQSELNSIFTNKGEGWEETTLKANIELSTGFAFKSKFYTDNEDDILLLRGDNIMQGDFRWQDVKRWNKSEYDDYQKYKLQENDIVLAMDRPWVKAGLKCAKLTTNEVPSLLVQRTARLRANSKIDSSFLYHLIRSKGFITYLLKGQTGLGVPHISGPQILSFSFSRPSLTEQQKIVQQLDKLSAETKRLEATYQQRLDALEELKKSILQKAFSGELSKI